MDIQSGRYCTVVVIDAVLFAIFGSSVFAIVAAFSVITVPAGAVTFTVRRTVHVVFGAMLLFSLQTIWPVPPKGGVVQVPSPGVPEMRMESKVVPAGTCVFRTS